MKNSLLLRIVLSGILCAHPLLSYAERPEESLVPGTLTGFTLMQRYLNLAFHNPSPEVKAVKDALDAAHRDVIAALDQDTRAQIAASMRQQAAAQAWFKTTDRLKIEAGWSDYNFDSTRNLHGSFAKKYTESLAKPSLQARQPNESLTGTYIDPWLQHVQKNYGNEKVRLFSHAANYELNSAGVDQNSNWGKTTLAMDLLRKGQVIGRNAAGPDYEGSRRLVAIALSIDPVLFTITFNDLLKAIDQLERPELIAVNKTLGFSHVSEKSNETLKSKIHEQILENNQYQELVAYEHENSGHVTQSYFTSLVPRSSVLVTRLVNLAKIAAYTSITLHELNSWIGRALDQDAAVHGHNEDHINLYAPLRKSLPLRNRAQALPVLLALPELAQFEIVVAALKHGMKGIIRNVAQVNFDYNPPRLVDYAYDTSPCNEALQ
ncbi:MAG: hypothetical protein AB7N80_16195 [Bdellovibrionales bacterium]